VQDGIPGPTRARHPPAPHAPTAEACAQASELGLPANFGLRASEIQSRASRTGLRLVCRCLARKRNPVARKPNRLAIGIAVPRAQARSGCAQGCFACAQASPVGVRTNLVGAWSSAPCAQGSRACTRKLRDLETGSRSGALSPFRWTRGPFVTARRSTEPCDVSRRPAQSLVDVREAMTVRTV
jgi:hypothetical protein